MESSPDHNKIIRQAAGEALKPLGLYQVGRSRLWAEDNGWYLTLVEFQPSGWSKGSYLNVALHFLWEPADYISFNYPFSGQTRQNGFVAFSGGEETFYEAMTAMAKKAAGLVEEYRKFRELSYAKRAILEGKRNSSHDILAKLMICGLTRDPLAERCYLQLLTVLEACLERAPKADYYAHELDYANSFREAVHDPDLLQARVAEAVNGRRDRLRAKPSYKWLSPEPFFPPAISPPPPEGLSKRNPWWRFWGNSNS